MRWVCLGMWTAACRKGGLVVKVECRKAGGGETAFTLECESVCVGREV